MATVVNHARAADRMVRFVGESAKRAGVPASERDDVVGDALLEITETLGATQFDLLLESIGVATKIMEVFRGDPRGRKALRAIDRTIDRFKPAMATFTDIRFHDESDHWS